MVRQISLRNKRVAVTGSAGFIGSNLVDRLVNEECAIVGIDNLSTGIAARGSADRFKGHAHYAFHQADVTDLETMCNLFKGCDTVFHLAALARVSFSVDHPIEANHANITGTLTVLEAARRAKVRRVVFSCSSSIFGGVKSFPTAENSRSCPLSPYALQKATGAEYCRLYSELHNLETVNLLYYNVFGPHQCAGSAYNTVIPAFFDAALKNEPCRIDGSGKQSRDFCFVSNVVDALVLATKCDHRFKGDLINIACGETYSVNQVFNCVARIVGGNLRKKHVSARLGDPKKSHADIGKARKILGYKPGIMFEQGMQITGQWWLAGQPTNWQFGKEN